MFPAKISDLPLHREVDSSIMLVLRASLASKAPYKINTHELVEFNLQPKEILYKGYIRPSVSPWGAPMLFVKKKGWYSQIVH